MTDTSMSSSELTALALVVALLVLVRLMRHNRLVAAERAWRPPELREAELVYVEKQFRTRWPIRLIARIDRGYRRSDGMIILVELKTRPVNRPYFSDVIELSAQRLAVEGQTGDPVADHGYVLVQEPGSAKQASHRVALLPREELAALARRREDILAGSTEARPACSVGLCRKCAFRTPCRPFKGQDIAATPAVPVDP